MTENGRLQKVVQEANEKIASQQLLLERKDDEAFNLHAELNYIVDNQDQIIADQVAKKGGKKPETEK